MELLNPKGRLGYIAPSLWRYNEYGEGLRKLLHDGGHLDRWIDFGSFQVFDEAIVYTALQFYSRSKNDRVRFALAPSGELTRIHDWDDPNWFVSYKELPKKDAWILVPRHERAVINKLAASCKRLDDHAITRQIFQGLITSADYIYQLKRLGKNRYEFQPPKPDNSKVKPPAEEIEIEDAIMHPLVSGPEANRYELPETSTYILFPYEVAHSKEELLSQGRMADEFPNAWKHLTRFETQLRERESKKFDDEKWYRFGRHQSIDKQEDRKLIVAQTVQALAVCPDDKGKFYLNNVRVNGILVTKEPEFWYLLGVLNSQVADWVFRRIAKPKDGGYFEANKQFIAPLPVPKASPGVINDVSVLAKNLTQHHTDRRSVLHDLERRFAACDVAKKTEEWLWPKQVKSLDYLKAAAPKELKPAAKARWAKEERTRLVELSVQAMQDRLRIGARLAADYAKGELRLMDEETAVLDGIFVDAEEASQIVVHWRDYLRDRPVSESSSAADLSAALRNIRRTDNKALHAQIFDLDKKLTDLDADIALAETSLNVLAFKLYDLQPNEIAIVRNLAVPSKAVVETAQ